MFFKKKKVMKEPTEAKDISTRVLGRPEEKTLEEALKYYEDKHNPDKKDN